MEAVASGLMGAAIAVLMWWIFRVLESDDLAQGAEWRYDVSRMNELRRIDPLYRLFYPVFTVLARVNRAVFREGLPEIQRQVQAAGLPRFWLPEEYLARLQVIAILTMPLWIYCMVWLFGPEAMLLAPVGVVAHGMVPALSFGGPGVDPLAAYQAADALLAGPADAADGSRGDIPQRPESGR